LTPRFLDRIARQRCGFWFARHLPAVAALAGALVTTPDCAVVFPRAPTDFLRLPITDTENPKTIVAPCQTLPQWNYQSCRCYERISVGQGQQRFNLGVGVTCLVAHSVVTNTCTLICINRGLSTTNRPMAKFKTIGPKDAAPIAAV
jgi:hypothetical protein